MEILIDQIKIDVARIRKDVGDIDELSASIKSHGLIHAIVLDENDNIIAGFRRYLAVRGLGRTSIRAERFTDLSELQKKQIELEENVRRLQLTWQEEVTAKKELHHIMQTLHGVSSQGKAGGWKVEDTAKLLGQSVGMTSMDLGLAEAVEVLPIIGEATSKTAAIKVTRKAKESAILRELSKRKPQTAAAFLRHVVTHGDCLEVLDTFESDSIDLVITDPPYGVSYDEVRINRDDTYEGVRFKDDVAYAIDLVTTVAPKLFRVMKPGSLLYVFTSFVNYPAFSKAFEGVGFWVRAVPLVWVKRMPTPGQVGSGGFMNRYELIIFAAKDVPRVLRAVANDVLEYGAPTTRIHATEKPVELLKYLIELSCEPEELVLDPFAGSGSTCIAATLSNRRSIGIEVDEQCHGAAIARLEGGLK